MQITIRLFAFHAQQAGAAAIPLELPASATAADATEALRSRFPALTWPPRTLLAVNREYVSSDQPLAPGDELAIIPPVSGG